MNLTLTQSCISKLNEIVAEETQSNTKKMFLRVFVQGGGCSGFQYGFTLEEEFNDDDFIQEVSQTVSLIVDSISFQYLNGAEIDYTEQLMENKFVIKNPVATNTCSCGSSFSI